MGGCSGQVRQRHARTCVAVLPTSLPAPKRRQRHVPLRARHTVRPSRALAHSAPIASTTHTAACSAIVLYPADSGKCLYVSGIPGTGKTATVLEVMRAMKRKRCAMQ